MKLWEHYLILEREITYEDYDRQRGRITWGACQELQRGQVGRSKYNKKIIEKIGS